MNTPRREQRLNQLRAAYVSRRSLPPVKPETRREPGYEGSVIMLGRALGALVLVLIGLAVWLVLR